MRIAKVSLPRYKKNLRTVVFEGGASVKLHEEVVERRGLAEGSEVSELDLEGLKDESSRREARDYSLLLLGYRTLSQNALKERLRRRGYAVKVIDGVLEELKAMKLLDDAGLARSMAESRLKGALVGDARVRSDMLRRGIPRETADSALAEANRDPGNEVPSEEERAYQLAARRAKQMRTDARTAYRRIYGYLARRGFPPDTIDRALARISARRREKEEMEREDDRD